MVLSDNLRLSAANRHHHHGPRPGQEVVQVYVRDSEARLQRPNKELKAFAKVALEPGERRMVTLQLAREAFAYFDDRAEAWVAEAGAFEIMVGPRRATSALQSESTSRQSANCALSRMSSALSRSLLAIRLSASSRVIPHACIWRNARRSNAVSIDVSRYQRSSKS
jgi:Fibronectin type III-like domain